MRDNLAWSATPMMLPIIKTTDTTDSEIFDTFFKSYEDAFVLPDEMEDRDGFASCLALNHGRARESLVARFGEFRELCVVAHDPSTGESIGGANFIAMPGASVANRAVVTANLNYIFIDKSARGRGWLRSFLSAIREHVAGMFPHDAGRSSETLMFIEQNDPLRMTAEAFARDRDFSGIDQFDRLRVWASQGARVVDFAYIQPPLSDQHAADDSLVYSVLGASNAFLSSCVLQKHLQSFFGISVLKGKELAAVPTASAQLERLSVDCRNNGSVRLLDPGPALRGLDREKEAALLAGPHHSLRQWLSTLQSS